MKGLYGRDRRPPLEPDTTRPGKPSAFGVDGGGGGDPGLGFVITGI